MNTATCRTFTCPFCRKKNTILANGNGKICRHLVEGSNVYRRSDYVLKSVKFYNKHEENCVCADEDAVTYISFKDAKECMLNDAQFVISFPENGCGWYWDGELITVGRAGALRQSCMKTIEELFGNEKEAIIQSDPQGTYSKLKQQGVKDTEVTP